MVFPNRHPSVVIVGGGPAGLTAAAEFARLGIGVTLVEKEGFASTRVGEHIGPATVQQLRMMGLADAVDPADHFACSGIDAWWGSSTPTTTTICGIRSGSASTYRARGSTRHLRGCAASEARRSWPPRESFARAAGRAAGI